jgi:hypothetical protein
MAAGAAGTLTGTAGTTNTFLCQSAGSATVTVTAAISGGGASCPNDGSLSTTVTCDSLADATVADVATPSEASVGTADAAEAATTAPEAAPEAGPSIPYASTSETGPAVEAGPLAPCTSAGQANCVPCSGNNSGICTPTEAIFVQRDIDEGFANVDGGDNLSNGCYSCLYNAACLDSDALGVTGHECADALDVGTAAECLATLSCINGSNCASAQVVTCYCGTASPTTTCYGTASQANGSCASEIAAGNGFAVADGVDNLTDLTNKTYASGKADQIYQCAHSNSCTMCTQ